MNENPKNVWRLEQGTRVTEQFDWKPILFFVGIGFLAHADQRLNNSWLHAVVLVVLYGFAALLLAGVVMYLLGGKARESIKSKAVPVIYVPHAVEISIEDSFLMKDDFEADKRVWWSRSKVRLDDIWGVKEIGDQVKVIKMPMYQTAFTFHSACFTTAEEKERFYSILEQHGAKIIRRPEPAAETA